MKKTKLFKDLKFKTPLPLKSYYAELEIIYLYVQNPDFMLYENQLEFDFEERAGNFAAGEDFHFKHSFDKRLSLYSISFKFFK